MIQRYTPLKRLGKPIPARRARPRRGPGETPAEEWRNRAYRQFLSEEGKCIVCWKCPTPGNGKDPFNWIIDAAHTENNGMRSKGRDSSCVPLCRVHHQEYDQDRKAFEARYMIDMKKEAGIWWAAFVIWREGQ